ncbi:KGGVGR-motif variant AAA ATPase [Streptomyces corynorhini]|uniref:ParA family protein n=1 Tax=Streptomyces corynorhini TaxID=2282652 RepID=A0A370BFK8_9ACTN|nr:AAA family ATPase [Streptomyces corynorhini]RDG38583.1 ParA family protein [Streptomyces corynorhini]
MVDGYAPPASANLLTWVDVDERCAELAVAGRWPNWLLEASAWWDGLELTVVPGTTEPQARGWLDDVFGTGSVEGEAGAPVLLLDRPGDLPADGLIVRLIHEESFDPGERTPRLMQRRITGQLAHPLPRPEQSAFAADVQVIAFHSFKGGAGRTVHAVALADLLAGRGHGVLLVDGDLEAPGITWMHQAQGGACDISYEDLLALLHGSVDGDVVPAARVAAQYLLNQEAARYPEGKLVVMPASRRARLGPSRIEPADLAMPGRSLYFLTEALAEVAAAAGLDTVIVDLRAGASELSAPILLDPRVQRMFVATLSSQSLDGTERLIRQLAVAAPAVTGQDPSPAGIITQYRLDTHTEQVATARTRFSEALAELCVARPAGEMAGGAGLPTPEVDAQVLTETITSPFRDELLALPRSWNDALDVVRRCGVGERLVELAPIRPAKPEQKPIGSVSDGRDLLYQQAKSLIFAEKTALDGALGFLATEPLRRLVGDHRTTLPVAVVVGAKGAGKTFTYARLCAEGEWSDFAGKANETVQVTASVVPVLDPTNMDQSVEGRTGPQARRDMLAKGHGATAQDIKRILREELKSPRSEDVDYWRTVWLRCMVLAAYGPAVRDEDPERLLIERGKQRRLIFVLDGLEDFFQALDGENKLTALRSLFTEVPDWLRMLRGRPLGIVIFARRDLVLAALRQNNGQFLDRYAPYALHWDAQEALRLALWVAVTAGAVPRPVEDLMDLSRERIAEELVPVWGAKMGREKSRQAISHRWVPAALADFNKQVQARDVVRFLSEAAEGSRGDRDWEDRLLTPAAMRDALVPCSEHKFVELAQENPTLEDRLRRLREFAATVPMPFTAEDVGLEPGEVAELTEAGALVRDHDGRYRLPEIYRHALKFRTARGSARIVN